MLGIQLPQRYLGPFMWRRSQILFNDTRKLRSSHSPRLNAMVDSRNDGGEKCELVEWLEMIRLRALRGRDHVSHSTH